MLHGLQIWVALPKELEQMDPTFVHVEQSDIPSWEKDGVSYKLIAGEAFGKKSPVPVYNPLYFIEIKSTSPQKINIGNDLFGESGLYILEGSIKSGDYVYGPKQILITNDSTLCAFEISENTTIYIFGGTPLPEEHFIFWNFVSSDKNTIEKAKNDWLAQTFPKVPGETEFVPLPKPQLK
jgi:redox-sensitive bicupin YhaK (pirin superfamily)